MTHLFDQSCVTKWQYNSTRSRTFYMFWVWKPEGWVCGGVSYGSYAYFTHNSALRRLRKWLNFPFQLYVYSNPSKQSHLVEFIIHIALLEHIRGGGVGVGKNWKINMINAIFILFMLCFQVCCLTWRDDIKNVFLLKNFFLFFRITNSRIKFPFLLFT